MRLHYLQHVPFEDPAAVGEWAADRGHAIAGTHLFAGQPLPTPDAFDWLLVLGGPMSANDEGRYDWLRPEKQLIADAAAAGKVVLGICLGAQLLADALGGRVYPNRHQEIGWFDVLATNESVRSWVFWPLPPRFEAFHWHGDTFDLPPGAVRLAATEATPNQAFEYEGRCVGLQFHLEYSRGSIQRMIEHCGGDAQPGPYVQPASSFLAPDADLKIERARGLLFAILDGIAKSRSGRGG